jgi:hypothetical protein
MIDHDDHDVEGGGLALASSVKTSKRKIRHRKQLAKFKERLHELGWRKTYIDRHVEDNIGADLDQQSETVLLDTWTKSWITMKMNDINTDEYILYSAGLNRKMAKMLSGIITSLYNTCYSRRQLLEIAIEYALGKYDPVLKPDQEYYFESDEHEVWTPNSLFKYIYNVPQLARLRSRLPIVPGSHSSADSKIFYHATNIKSAIHIARHGISHLKGRGCLDFGIQPSFYMTPDLSTAIHWCEVNKTRWHGELCIILFSIPNDSLRALKGKVFENATSEWVELVTSSRICQAEINDLDWYDSVYGPMAANIRAICSRGVVARTHATPKFQLASKSNTSDMYFRNCLSGAIFVRADHL